MRSCVGYGVDYMCLVESDMFEDVDQMLLMSSSGGKDGIGRAALRNLMKDKKGKRRRKS